MENREDMESFSNGFTQIPHKLANVLIFTNLTARQRRVLDLIIRLTYGCQRRWAKLKYKDLRVVGIPPSHVKEVLTPLLESLIVIQNGKSKEFRVNEEFIASEVTKKVSIELKYLRKLVTKQLEKESNNFSTDETTKLGKHLFSLKKNTVTNIDEEKKLPDQENLFTDKASFVFPKDNINKKKEKDIKKRKVNPRYYFPSNELEFASYSAWDTLEPENPESFDFYLSAAKKGLPIVKFHEFTSEIKNNRTIKNKGAAFVVKVQDYFKNL